jgi:hypothetical protein
VVNLEIRPAHAHNDLGSCAVLWVDLVYPELEVEHIEQLLDWNLLGLLLALLIIAS